MPPTEVSFNGPVFACFRSRKKNEETELCASRMRGWIKTIQSDTIEAWPSGGIGRRTGLKIPWGVSPVWVRVPPRLLDLRRFGTPAKAANTQ